MGVDNVPDDVTCRPLLTRRRALPPVGGHRRDRVGEGTGHPTVSIGGVTHRVSIAPDVGGSPGSVLAAADLGVAMGCRGSDLAVETADAETADVMIVRGDLGALPAVITLSRRARRLVSGDLVIAAAELHGGTRTGPSHHIRRYIGIGEPR